MRKHNSVNVVDINEKPLHSTRNFAHVRHLLRKGKAEVYSKEPFTIRLLKKV